MGGWVGVDLDGTLARYYDWESGVKFIGDPVPEIEKIVRGLVANGVRIKIFTARVGKGNDIEVQTKLIHAWLREWDFPIFEITCAKDYEMITCIDDRCIAVETNTGLIKGGQEILKHLLGES